MNWSLAAFLAVIGIWIAITAMLAHRVEWAWFLF